MLFVAHETWKGSASSTEPTRRIELTEHDLRQLSVAWRAQGRPAPSPAQLRSLVEKRVREEVLYREALALGLDEGDTIVRRRLAQKMEFLVEDTSAVPEPTVEELRAFFDAHSERFARPARLGFRHLYFSPDRRGERARSDAERALRRLRGRPLDAPTAAEGADPFMFQDHYGDRTREQVSALFGSAFAGELFQLPTGSWQGPIESGYGWHVVWVSSIQPVRTPAFEAVEADVRAEWLADRRSRARERAFDAMRARYEVALPPLPADAGASFARVAR